MKIPKNFREELVKEINFVAERMRKEPDPRKKLYYYSGVYGLVNRTFNINFDPELLFMHLILNSTYGIMKSRVDAIILGRDTLIEVPDNLFDRLSDALEELAENVEKNEETYLTLQKIANLAYVTTGNGFYLYQKGILKI